MNILTSSKDNMTDFSWFRGFYFSQNYNLFSDFLFLTSRRDSSPGSLTGWTICLWLGLWSLQLVWWCFPSLIILFIMATVAVKFEKPWTLLKQPTFQSTLENFDNSVKSKVKRKPQITHLSFSSSQFSLGMLHFSVHLSSSFAIPSSLAFLSFPVFFRHRIFIFVFSFYLSPFWAIKWNSRVLFLFFLFCFYLGDFMDLYIILCFLLVLC